MKLSIPFFWRKKHFIAYLLLPLSLIYYLIFIIKKRLTINKANFLYPLLTIGNVTVGGAGKTPCAIAIADLLKKKRLKSCFLSKGYLGNLSGPIIIDAAKHSAKQVGDEALLLNKHSYTVISKKRYLAKQLVDSLQADLIIMDDGLQNHHIKHQLKIVVIDASFLFGNGFLLPAGPLRECYNPVLTDADFIIYIGKEEFFINKPYYKKYQYKSYIGAYKALHIHNKNDQYLAFSALGNNQKFFTHLKDNGYNIKLTKEFPDHYFYNDQDIKDLLKLAKQEKLKLITTSKDIVKINEIFYDHIIEHKITIKFKQEQKLLDDLVKKIKPLS